MSDPSLYTPMSNSPLLIASNAFKFHKTKPFKCFTTSFGTLLIRHQRSLPP